MSYQIGITVFRDGHIIGQIQHLIIDPRSKQITHFVVTNHHIEEKLSKIIPTSLIYIQTQRAIILLPHIEWDDLDTFHINYYKQSNGTGRVYEPKVTVHPLYYYPPEPNTEARASRSEPLPYRLIHIGKTIYDSQQRRCGVVSAIQSNDDGYVDYIIMHATEYDNRSVHVPVEQIAQVADGNIILHRTYQDLFH